MTKPSHPVLLQNAAVLVSAVEPQLSPELGSRHGYLSSDSKYPSFSPVALSIWRHYLPCFIYPTSSSSVFAGFLCNELFPSTPWLVLCFGFVLWGFWVLFGGCVLLCFFVWWWFWVFFWHLFLYPSDFQRVVTNA